MNQIDSYTPFETCDGTEIANSTNIECTYEIFPLKLFNGEKLK